MPSKLPPILEEVPLRIHRGEPCIRNLLDCGKTVTPLLLSIQPLSSISKTESPGGEGLAFIIAGDSTLPPYSEGRWLGIVNSDPNGSPVVAVEFDTRKSDDQDLDDNHIGLDINSINSNASVSLTHFGFNISGGHDLRVLLQYDGQNWTVRVNETLVLSQRLDLSIYLPKKVFVGFSASTSNETQLNCVKSWEFSGTDIGGEGNLLWVA
ncbi:hypothetical protein Goklo_027173 [Gossypium klotzschianum]|uniref:Legume lectin domain-containing protein n=1 Tax=Gossypium klotzschianum TaxID=34286 RepID=A0A7J8TXQ0_9ROSI|nr:hypothetical protein [Gossypium klotzschianum]